MSQEEIERILSTDLHQIDQHVDHKINAIEQITEALTQRSQFINDFQEMLKRQLQLIHCNFDDSCEQNQQELQSISMDSHFETCQKAKNNNFQGEVFELNNDLMQQRIGQKQQRMNEKKGDNKALNDLLRQQNEQLSKGWMQEKEKLKRKALNLPLNDLTNAYLNQEEKLYTFKSREITSSKKAITKPKQINRNKLTHAFQMFHSQFASFNEEIVQNLENCKKQSVKFLRHSIYEVIQLINNVYQDKMNDLLNRHQQINQQNTLLHRKIKQKSDQNLKLIEKLQSLKISHKNNSNASKYFDLNKIPMNLQKYEEFQMRSISSKIKRNQKTVNSIEQQLRETSNFGFNQNKFINQSSHSKKSQYFDSSQVMSIDELPSIKPVSIGMGAVRNGFGILKIGSEVIYKGMWREGKFNGKGKLTFNNYCYEGDFVNGVFEGVGTLKTNNLIYIGAFKNQLAEGEGSCTTQGKVIYGYWFQNKLRRQI